MTMTETTEITQDDKIYYVIRHHFSACASGMNFLERFSGVEDLFSRLPRYSAKKVGPFVNWLLSQAVLLLTQDESVYVAGSAVNVLLDSRVPHLSRMKPADIITGIIHTIAHPYDDGVYARHIIGSMSHHQVQALLCRSATLQYALVYRLAAIYDDIHGDNCVVRWPKPAKPKKRKKSKAKA